MSDQLDLLLGSAREPEPFDENFVQAVMTEVHRVEARRTYRRGLRRPMVMGIAAAIVVTGGAVAAVVGTNPSDDARTTDPPASVVTVTRPGADPTAPGSAPAAGTASDGTSPAEATTPAGRGYSSDHVSFTLDEATGLSLQTDTHTNIFTVGRTQRVTLTLENTGRYPIAVSSSDGCPLQVMAYGDHDPTTAPDTSLLTDPQARFEWECAGSDDDPRTGGGSTTWVLAPGERTTADAFLVLDQTGDWSVSGMCRCTYEQVKPTPVPKSDPLQGLEVPAALPSPLLPEQPDGRNLVTPPIAVRAD